MTEPVNPSPRRADDQPFAPRSAWPARAADADSQNPVSGSPRPSAPDDDTHVGAAARRPSRTRPSREQIAAMYARRRILVLTVAGLALLMLLGAFLYRPAPREGVAVGHPAPETTAGRPSETRTGPTPPPSQGGAPSTPATPFDQTGVRMGEWFVSAKTTTTGAQTVAVLVEPGLHVDANAAGELVNTVLNDPRGWASQGYSFKMVADPDDAAIRIHITTPKLTDEKCAPMETAGYVSCTWASGDIYLNSDRWLTGVPHFKSIDTYRDYLISHETGHALGYGHVACEGPGKPAPVMMQQTYGLNGCVENGWVQITGG